MKNKKILFFSTVKDLRLFKTQTFYKNDIKCLTSSGYEVVLSNNLKDFFLKKYDVAFLYFYKYSLFASLIAKIRSKKVYITGGIDSLSGVEGLFSQFIQILLLNALLWFVNKCFIVSKSDLQNMRNSTFSILHKKFYYSPHSIEIEGISNISLENRENNFLTICWMESAKNIKRKGVIKAIENFNFQKEKSDEFIKSKLFIVGKYNEEGMRYIKSQVEPRMLNDVLFTGLISDHEKINYFKTNKYYYQLSEYEGFGLAALEALSYGVYVLHSGKGGLKDTLKEYCHVINNDSKKIIGYEKFVLRFKTIIDEINCSFSHDNRMADFKKFIDNKY